MNTQTCFLRVLKACLLAMFLLYGRAATCAEPIVPDRECGTDYCLGAFSAPSPALFQAPGQSSPLPPAPAPAPDLVQVAVSNPVSLVWRNYVQGYNSLWKMQGAEVDAKNRILDIRVPWTIVGVADFDNDGKDDLLWRNGNEAKLVIMYMDGQNRRENLPLSNIVVQRPWNVVGVADFDGDTKQDILWRNDSLGRTVIMLLDGDARKENIILPAIYAPWYVVGVGDFDNDGKADIVWRNHNLARTVFMLMDGVQIKQKIILDRTVKSHWYVKATGDFDGDGKTDLVWRNIYGSNSIMFMDGTSARSTSPLPKVPL